MAIPPTGPTGTTPPLTGTIPRENLELPSTTVEGRDIKITTGLSPKVSPTIIPIGDPTPEENIFARERSPTPPIVTTYHYVETTQQAAAAATGGIPPISHPAVGNSLNPNTSSQAPLAPPPTSSSSREGWGAWLRHKILSIFSFFLFPFRCCVGRK